MMEEYMGLSPAWGGQLPNRHRHLLLEGTERLRDAWLV